MNESLIDKFPAILRDKLRNGEIILPEETEYIYNDIKAYRAVQRKENDYSTPTLEKDFKSYFELKKTPKKPRGAALIDDPHYYGVSFFKNKEMVGQLMQFPNPNKKMMVGYIYSNGGSPVSMGLVFPVLL